tara:strand:- start:363 stop:479 length:117 start_codon:yes stop_codon:yes gene_type:complete
VVVELVVAVVVVAVVVVAAGERPSAVCVEEAHKSQEDG